MNREENMILIEPLKRALEIVKIFNGLGREQLAFLMKTEYPNRKPDMDIDKLLRMKLIFSTDDSVHIPGRSCNKNIRQTVEIMLEICGCDFFIFDKSKKPFLLDFIVIRNDKAHKYCVGEYNGIS